MVVSICLSVDQMSFTFLFSKVVTTVNTKVVRCRVRRIIRQICLVSRVIDRNGTKTGTREIEKTTTAGFKRRKRRERENELMFV